MNQFNCSICEPTNFFYFFFESSVKQIFSSFIFCTKPILGIEVWVEECLGQLKWALPLASRIIEVKIYWIKWPSNNNLEWKCAHLVWNIYSFYIFTRSFKTLTLSMITNQIKDHPNCRLWIEHENFIKQFWCQIIKSISWT